MRRLLVGLAALLALPLSSCAGTASPASASAGPSRAVVQIDPSFEGTWQLDAARSTSIDPWRNLTVEVDVQGEAVVLQRKWRGSREGGASTDSSRFVPGGPAVRVPLDQWADNRHLGAFLAGDSTKTLVGRVEDGGQTLVTESRLVVVVQQGERPIRIYTEYRLAPGGDRLDVLELRSTRPTPMHYVFTRAQS